LFGLNTAASILGDISPTYFVAVSALVASFFGASAYQSKKESKNDPTTPRTGSRPS